MHPILKKWLLLLWLPLFSLTTAQTVEHLEKIKNELSRQERSYKNRKRIYNMALRFPPARADSTLFYGDVLIRQNNDTSRISGTLLKGIAYYRSGRFDSSRIFLKQVIKQSANKRFFLQDYMSAKSHLALLYLRTQKLSRAKTLFEELLRTAEKEGLKRNIISSSQNLGMIYRHLGQPRKAIDYFQKAIALDSNAVFTVANAYMSIADIYSTMEDYTMADSYYRKARKKQPPSPSFSVALFNNMAGNFKKMNRADSMVHYYNLALSTATPARQNHQIIRPLRELAIYESEQGNFNKAEELFQKALSVAQKITFPREALNTYIETARFYRQWGKYEQSLRQARQALKLAQDRKIRFLLRDTYKIMAGDYEALGKLEQAHASLLRHTALTDSIDNRARERIKMDIRAGYDLEKERERLKQTQRENRAQLLILTVIFALLLSAGTGLYLSYRKKIEEKAELETSVKQQQERIKKLQLKIEDYNRRMEKESGHKAYILLKNNQKIEYADLIYIKVDGHYLDYYTTLQEQPFIERQALKNIISQLPPVLFIQIHRSYIVNISFIKSFSSHYLTLKSGREIKISRTYKPRLKEILYSDN